jgi:hypothetical protein
LRCLSFLRNETLNKKWHDDSTLETIIVTLSRVLALVKRRRFRRETDKKEETETVHLQYDDFMMSLSSLSFVHPKNVNVGFQNPIREKSRSNVMKKQRRRRRLRAKTPQTRAMAAVQDEEATKPQPEPANWEYKYLYDGACPVCRSLKAGLEGTSTLSLQQRGVLCVGFLKYAFA